MKAIAAGAGIPVTDIRSYLYVCQRKQNELEFYIPCTTMADVQVYVELGSFKPLSQTISLVNLCDNTYAPLIADQYIIGKDADGNWYGVFTFADAVPPPMFAIAIELAAGEETYTFFTEGYRLETCGVVKKVSACFPISRQDEFGFDSNGIYFGTSTDLGNSLGDTTLSYNHYAWVRRAKVFQEVPKLTFTANFRRNFRTNLTRQYEFRCETVPDWYKEYLLSIYTRGFVQIDNIIYQVTDLNFEGVNEDDITWKPYAKLQIATNYQFGCEDCTPAAPCCDPVIDSVVQETITPTPLTVTGTLAPVCVGERQQCGQQASTKLRFTIPQPLIKDLKLQVAYVFGFEGAGGAVLNGNYEGAGGDMLPEGHPDKANAYRFNAKAPAEIIIPANTTNWQSDYIAFVISGTIYKHYMECYPLCNGTYGPYYKLRIYLKVVSPDPAIVLNIAPAIANNPYNLADNSITITQIL